MRIVTRPDFDGVVCAVLLKDALEIDKATLWVQPSEMQRGEIDIKDGDVIANLPYHKNCSLWFDHHFSNRPDFPVAGAFEIAPSAAGIIYKYYRKKLAKDYDELIHQTDRIDSADLILDEILRPENHPYVHLSMTIAGDDPEKEKYWDHLVNLLRTQTVDKVMADPMVKKRAEQVVADNLAYEKALKAHTTMVEQVSVTDFRELNSAPDGNRFLVYSLFPDCTVNVKIVYKDPDLASIKVGHSILNKGCNVNVGKMLSLFEGGGHPGAGACRFSREKAPDYLKRIIEILVENKPDEAEQ
jgi:oligoribonuclease NrnB/cAMP/cGMP phosphodiesterase (DHH superfamily)